MIVQPTPAGPLLFRQTDHALLSGAFATAWGGDAFDVPPRRVSALIAAARHDDGWADWELAPRLNPDGSPVDFIRIPVDEHTALYRHGIDLVCGEDDFAGLVVSLHGQRLYTRPFHPGMKPRIENLDGAARTLAQRYVDHEHERQVGIAARLGEDAIAEAEECWRLLQVWDRLSLFVCMQPLNGQGSSTMPRVRGAGGRDVALEVRSEEGGLVLRPYPFADAPARFEIDAYAPNGSPWADETAFRHAYRLASRQTIRFTCRPA